MTESVPVRVVQRQLDDLALRIEKKLDQINETITALDERMRELEKQEAASIPLLNTRVDAVWRKVDEHENNIKDLSKVVNELANTNRILKWILGLFTVVLGAVLVGLATGQLIVVMK